MRLLALSLAPLALALALAPTAAAASTVKVMGGFFDPATLDVLAGEEVTFLNEDATPHTVTSSWDAGASFDEVLRAGETFTYAFTQEGTFGVHCRPHSGMEMRVDVRAVEAPGNIGAPLKDVPAPAFALVLVSALVALGLARRTRA